VLNLNANQLTGLAPEISQLTQLIRFNLDANQLTYLPLEIGQLTGLTELILSHNQLTSLPPEIGQLTGLTELDLRHNQLTALPSEIGALKGLRWLRVASNQLTSMPSEISDLKELYVFDVRANQLKRIPLIFLAPPASFNIYVYDNPLEHVPESIMNQGNGAILAYLRQPDPHIVTSMFWWTMIAFPVTLIIGGWALMWVWASLANRNWRVIEYERTQRR
jgi:Leucine-rich repeat (LRR) protein